MKLALTPRQSQALAIALLVALLALLVAAVYFPVRNAHRHYDTAIEDRLDRTARYMRIAAQRDEITANVTSIKKKNAGRFYLQTSAPALAAAEVQQMALAIIEANKVQVESTQIGVHRDEGLQRKISVNFRLRGPMAEMQKTLYELETALPYFFVDNLAVSSVVNRLFRPTPGVQPDVQMQFDLYAFARIGAPASKVP